MVWYPKAVPFVNGMGVLLALARQAPELVAFGDNIFSKVPDDLTKFLPALVITRTGGDSARPEWQSSYFVHFQVWSDRTDEFPDDPFQAAFELSQRVARAFYRAKLEQTLAYDGDGHVMGWICDWRESSGFQDISDPDLPHIGRYIGVYDLLIRNRRPTSV